MTSTTIAQHTTQPLNFGPEWLRALSTPDSATTVSSSAGSSGSGNVFKFAATKYRYSKDEILALRANVSDRLAEDIRNEILENLKDVESVFRSNIIDPLALTSPTPEETARMSSLSSYISGRTPGGGGRGGGGSGQQQQQQQSGHGSQQQQQQHESLSGRGGSRGGGSLSNGRGNSRGRGGRDPGYGPNRGGNNLEDNGENGGGGDETSVPSSSWSRGGYHTRGGSFSTRVRSYDDRDQSQTFRRGGGGARQSSDGWRRSRGDDEENNNNNEQWDDSSTPANGSASWTGRSGPTRRGGGATGSMEQRTKSSDKWNYNDDRPGPSNSYESSQQRGGGGVGGWRTGGTMSDRDLNSRRGHQQQTVPRRERMPEWMHDNGEGDQNLSSATFEQDGTFTGSSSSATRQTNSNNTNSNERQLSTDESSSSSSRSNALPSRQEESNSTKSIPPMTEKSTPPQTDSAVVNVSTVSAPKSESIPVPEPTPPVQQSISTWDDEFEPSDVATTVVESTLAEDHDYSPPISAHSTPHPMSVEPTPPATTIIPQQRPTPVIVDDKQWYYKDPQNTVQGPFSSGDMERWFAAGYFTVLLPVKRLGETHFSTIQQLTKELGRLPFRTDIPAPPPPPPQQPTVPEPQKFNPMTYATPSTGNSAYIDEYLLQKQQQARPNVPHAMFVNRQTSMPLGTSDRKASNLPQQLQAYFASQQQQQPSSSLFASNIGNDPTIAYQQQHLQRSMSATAQQQSNAVLYDELQRSLHHHQQQQQQPVSNPPSSSSSLFFANSSQNQPNDILTRLTQAMQSHGQKQQQQEKIEEQQRRIEYERMKLLQQQAEQLRLQQREEEEEQQRRQLERQQQQQEENLRKKQQETNKQVLFDQMKEMLKTIDLKKQQTKPPPPPPAPVVEIDPFAAYQQSLQFQKEQQAKIEAQKAENVRRYQQQQLLREQQPSATFKLPETANWARHPSQNNDGQTLNFAEIQKQEQEQERRAQEAIAAAAQRHVKSDPMSIPGSASSSSSANKPSSWARTLFAAGGGGSGTGGVPSMNDFDPHENALPESSYNQQATNAVLSLLNIHPKSRSSHVGNSQQSTTTTPWNAAATGSNVHNASLQDIQRQQQQQAQNDSKQQQQQQQQQSFQFSSAPPTPAWGGFQQSGPSQQSSSLFWDNQYPTKAVPAAAASGNANKSSAPWTELKQQTVATTKPNSNNSGDVSKSEREAKCLFSTTRTQDALSKWTQIQFKDNLQAIDVPTLVQLLKDIESAEEIAEYVQPYMTTVGKAKEFANDFLVKRQQLSNAEPELDNERLNELAMAPTSSSSNAGSSGGGDEGFQLAASNGQKKKAKKMKGQKIDVKQLGFMVNNRPEQRDDIDRVQM